MKSHLIIPLILFLIMSNTSCRKLRPIATYEIEQKEKPIGQWKDIIQFSTTELIFDSKQNSRKITSKGDWWWISNHLQLNGETVYITEHTETIVSTKGEVEKGVFGIDAKDIIFDKGANEELKTINGEWFSIKKLSATELLIEVQKNETGKERTLIVPIQCGNYFTRINIKQKK